MRKQSKHQRVGLRVGLGESYSTGRPRLTGYENWPGHGHDRGRRAAGPWPSPGDEVKHRPGQERPFEPAMSRGVEYVPDQAIDELIDRLYV